MPKAWTVVPAPGRPQAGHGGEHVLASSAGSVDLGRMSGNASPSGENDRGSDARPERLVLPQGPTGTVTRLSTPPNRGQTARCARYGWFAVGNCRGGRTMGLRPLKASVLCVVAVLATACGGVAQSVHPATTTRPSASAPQQQVVTAGRLTFAVPSSWTVGYGACRCGWGEPGTVTLDNGPQGGGVTCNCPEEAGDAPSGLHLYEGQSGLVPGGTPTTINGIGSLVRLDLVGTHSRTSRQRSTTRLRRPKAKTARHALHSFELATAGFDHGVKCSLRPSFSGVSRSGTSPTSG